MIKQITLGIVLTIILAACGAAVEPTAVPPPTSELLRQAGMIDYYEMTLADGTAVTYGVVLPDNYEAGETYPVLLALPPGPQTEDMVAAGVEGYWGAEGQKRGWVVISPVAPNGRLFFQGSESVMPEFLERMAQLYPPEGEQFYLGGVSNGGISAFRIATAQPELFRAIAVLPGFPQSPDFQQLGKLTGIPVSMFVGERDTQWIQSMEAAQAELTRLGGEATLEIVPNEGHVIQSLVGGERLYDWLELHR